MKTKASKGSAVAKLAPEEDPGFVHPLLTKMARNFTVPSDDANFSPPKFAGWAGQPQVFSLYGISSLLFIATGAVILALARCWVPMEGGLNGDFSSSYLEGVGYILVGATSLHGDVICMGRRSYWHIADRVLAQLLIVGNVIQAVALFTVGARLGIAVLIAVSLPLACYASSYHHRVFEPYKVCHTLWHFTGATNRAVVAVVAWIFAESSPLVESQPLVFRALCAFLALEAFACAAVWSYSWWLHTQSQETAPYQMVAKGSPGSKLPRGA